MSATTEVTFEFRAVGDRVVLLRDEPDRVVISELEIPAAWILAEQLRRAIHRAEEHGT